MNREPVLSAILLVLLLEVAAIWYMEMYQVELLPSDICSFDEVAAYWYIMSYDVSIKCRRQTCSFNELQANWYIQCSIKLLPKYQVMPLSEARWVIRQCSISLYVVPLGFLFALGLVLSWTWFLFYSSQDVYFLSLSWYLSNYMWSWLMWVLPPSFFKYMTYGTSWLKCLSSLWSAVWKVAGGFGLPLESWSHQNFVFPSSLLQIYVNF